MNGAKVKLNMQSGEIEFEGSEQFVSEQMSNLEHIVNTISQFILAEPDEVEEEEEEEVLIIKESKIEQEKLEAVNENSLEPHGIFGEWLHSFKDDISDSDKALLTAYYIQKQNQTNDFKTKQVSDALKEHGIKLTNPSTSLMRLGQKKLIFQVRKVGTLKFQRVSTEGVKHLKTLKR